MTATNITKHCKKFLLFHGKIAINCTITCAPPTVRGHLLLVRYGKNCKTTLHWIKS